MLYEATNKSEENFLGKCNYNIKLEYPHKNIFFSFFVACPAFLRPPEVIWTHPSPNNPFPWSIEATQAEKPLPNGHCKIDVLRSVGAM